MFWLGFLSGVIFIFLVLTTVYLLGSKRRKAEQILYKARMDLLMKAVPVWQQARIILNTDDVDPKKLASLLVMASIIENDLETILNKAKTVN